MPRVGDKHFDYTPAGYKAAAQEAKRQARTGAPPKRRKKTRKAKSANRGR